MSSHREAPEISKDPVADNTDVYAFVSPKHPTYVTLIANFIPLQKPDGGPNFYEFGDDVLYEIKIANRARPRPTWSTSSGSTPRSGTRRRSSTTPAGSTARDTQWNRPQFYSVTRVKNGRKTVLGRDLRCPPVNIGPRSTPDYELAGQRRRHRLGLRPVFAGQRADGFHVDLGTIFDLGTLRPFSTCTCPVGRRDGRVDSRKTYNVHSIAIQVPITEVTRHGDSRPTRRTRAGHRCLGDGEPPQVADPRPEDRADPGHGPWQQVSRLGNPLFNEVIVPMA